MHINAGYRTYCGGGGCAPLTLAGEYLALDAPDFGADVETIDITGYFVHLRVKPIPGASAETLKEMYGTELETLPRYSFSRKKKVLLIDFRSRAASGEEIEQMPWDAPASLPIFKAFAEEIVAQIAAAKAKLSGEVDFDTRGFLSFLYGKLTEIPDDASWLADFEERAQEARNRRNEENDVSELAHEQKQPDLTLSEEEFWKCMASVDTEALDDGLEDDALAPLGSVLVQFNEDQLDSFDDHLAMALYRLDTRKHIEAAGFFNGGSDSFLYARCYVVAKGRDYYNRVLANAAEMPTAVEQWLEPLLYITADAWQQATGESRVYDTCVSYETGSNKEGWPDGDESEAAPIH